VEEDNIQTQKSNPRILNHSVDNPQLIDRDINILAFPY